MERQELWHVSGNNWEYAYPSKTVGKLENAHYILSMSMSGFYLNKVTTKFELPKKIYGNDGKFADRVIKTWEAKKNNIGVLLNGIKGSGKTVTSKMICNLIDLPIILITKEFKGMDEYLSSIKEDFVVFVDEYEKIFDKRDTLLTLMDGMLTNTNRRLFVLTTNEMYVSSYLIDRPNRIRYIRKYDQVSASIVEDMLDDLLINKAWKKDMIKFLSSLEMLTIDIINNVIEEVNIHNELPDNFKEFFNITMNNKKCNVYYRDDQDEETLLTTTYVRSQDFDEDDSVYINDRYLGDFIGRNGDESINITLVSNEDDLRYFPALKGRELAGEEITLVFEDQGYMVHSNFQTFDYKKKLKHEAKTMRDINVSGRRRGKEAEAKKLTSGVVMEAQDFHEKVSSFEMPLVKSFSSIVAKDLSGSDFQVSSDGA